MHLYSCGQVTVRMVTEGILWWVTHKTTIHLRILIQEAAAAAAKAKAKTAAKAEDAAAVATAAADQQGAAPYTMPCCTLMGRP